MTEKMSFAASQILEGLNEALMDAKGLPVEGLKKSTLRNPTEPTTKNHYLTDTLTGIVHKNVDYDVEREGVLRERLHLNAETRQAIEEIEHGVGLSRVFHSTDELMEDLTHDT